MTPFPLALNELVGRYGAYLVFLLIGFAFGFVLEIAGFGNSKKLAGQFYFTDMTVLKVMFGAIIVAMLMIFGATALGLLDYNLIWVNPTYLWPGIVGGFIMGIGFIIGGFCPGTSLVAAATWKIDGIFFALGALFGIFTFGETVGAFDIFWSSSYMGRLTVPEVLGIDTGVVVLLVVLMALFMFFGAEQLERIFGGKDPKNAPKWRYAAAGVLVLAAIAIIVLGQPTTEDRWEAISSEKEPLLQDRSVYIHPGELLHTLHDHKVNLMMLDVRDEVDYNLFHLADAQRVPLDELTNLTSEFQLEPANTVFVVMSNDEADATEAWKILVAESVPNVYILEGGINRWIETFAQEDERLRVLNDGDDEELRCEFAAALGSAFPASDPDAHSYEIEYEPKIKLELKRGPLGGGCG
jgi:rhodanese-related sulfurtransferase